MKTASTIAHALLVLLVIAVIAGCAGSRTQESTGEYFDDSTITAKVKAAILGDPDLKVVQISVEAFKGGVPVGGGWGEEKTGAKIVRRALEEPTRNRQVGGSCWLLRNTGRHRRVTLSHPITN